MSQEHTPNLTQVAVPGAKAVLKSDIDTTEARQGVNPAVTLQTSDNHHDLSSRAAGTHSAADKNVLLDREIIALLERMTMEQFDSLSAKLLGLVNRSEKEAETLRQVVDLVVKKAAIDGNWSTMCAMLCQKMMKEVAPGVRDERVRDRHGNLITGIQLFQHYIHDRCQEAFEYDRRADKNIEAAGGSKTDRRASYDVTNATFASQKAPNTSQRKPGEGVLKFICDLFRLGILTERFMYHCVKALSASPAEQDLEKLCNLMTSVGRILDTPEARTHMDLYFSKLEAISESSSTSLRVREMLLVRIFSDSCRCRSPGLIV